MPIQTDAIFMSDAECGAIIARARADHTTSTAYLGDRAPAFTQAHAEQALAAAVHSQQRTAAVIADQQAQTAVLQAASDTAYARSASAMNDWRT